MTDEQRDRSGGGGGVRTASQHAASTETNSRTTTWGRTGRVRKILTPSFLVRDPQAQKLKE